MKIQHLITLGILIFFANLSTLSAQSQCPDGWYYASFTTMNEPGTNCVYQVEICYYCTPTGQTNVSVKTLSISLVSGDCLAPDRDWLIGQIISYVRINCLVPNCTQGCRTFMIEIPSCWQWHWERNSYGWVAPWLEPCDLSLGKCQITRIICYNQNTGQYQACAPDTYNESSTYCQTEPVLPPDPENYPNIGSGTHGNCYKYYPCHP